MGQARRRPGQRRSSVSAALRRSGTTAPCGRGPVHVALAGAVVLTLTGCSLVMPDGDAAPDTSPAPEPVVTEVALPGDYDDEGRRTSHWHMLPGDDDLPALAAAVSQVMGTDDDPVATVWSAGAGEMFDDPVNLAAAGTDVQELVLGGDDSLAVVAGYRTEGSDEVAFMLTSTDRVSWAEIDLTPVADLNLTAAGGTQDLIVAVDTSADEHIQVVVVDHGQVDSVTIAPSDDVERAVVEHVFVRADRVILSGYQSAPGEADVATIWTSQDRGQRFTVMELDDDAAVAGVTRAGNRYFATGNRRDGQWLRPQVWTSGNGQDWHRFGIDFFQRDFGWQDYPENQGLTMPLGGGEDFFAGLWSANERRLMVVTYNREHRWTGTGLTERLPDFGITGLVAPDGPEGYRTLIISAETVQQHHWGEEVRDAELAEVIPGATVLSLVEMVEGPLVSTTRRGLHQGEDSLLRYPEQATHSVEGSADGLPDGMAEYGARSVADQDGVRIIVGSGGSELGRFPLWRQGEPDGAWTRHWIEAEGFADGVDIDGDSPAIFGHRITATEDLWVITGESGSYAAEAGRFATVWSSPNGQDWGKEDVLAGPGGTASAINDVCVWDAGVIAVGRYGHERGGNAPALWQRTGGDWERIEVDDDWRGSLSYCRITGGTLEVGSGRHWWTTTDTIDFIAGSDEPADPDDDTWESTTVEFDDGSARVRGSAQEVELSVSVSAGQWESVPMPMDADITGQVLAASDGDGLLFAEQDTGRAWQVENVAELLTWYATAAAAAEEAESEDAEDPEDP